MQEIYTEFIQKIFQNKDRLERELGVKLTNQGKNLFVDGEADKEFIALQIIDAVNTGFSVDKALLLKREDTILQTLHIKDLTKRKDLERVRARIIGKEGKTLRTLNNLTGCEFAIQENSVGIIGEAESINEAIQAVISLIQGSKQANVYARAEKEVKKQRLNPVDIRKSLRK
ncbi:MAG: KH domain-containing protein [Candidatus Pacearchaeota archaeon]|jgi:ribosomal RNA assembly protein